MNLTLAISLFFFAFVKAEELMIGENTIVADDLTIDPEDFIILYKKEKENFCTELDRMINTNICLKPSNVGPEKHVFVWVTAGYGRKMPLTSIVSSEVESKNAVKLVFKKGTKLIERGLMQYVLDLGDGGTLIRGVLKSETTFLLRFSESIFERFDKWSKRTGSKDVYIGGPYQQVVGLEFLQWSSFSMESLRKLTSKLMNITGTIQDIKTYWIKVNGADKPLYAGELVARENEAWEFTISALCVSPQLIADSINKHVQYDGNYRFGSVLSISLSPTADSKLPDRKCFDITGVNVKEKEVGITFNWLENQDGHSFTHIVKVKLGQEDAYLLAAVYFGKGANTGGTVIVYPPKDVSRDPAKIMQEVRDKFTKKKYDLQISGPCYNSDDVEMNGHYETPLQLVDTRNPKLRDSHFLEFSFSSSK